MFLRLGGVDIQAEDQCRLSEYAWCLARATPGAERRHDGVYAGTDDLRHGLQIKTARGPHERRVIHGHQ